jgi:hypothetical protein
MDTKVDTKRRSNDPARNPDPITKAPGAHPVGTGVGAAVGGAAVGGGAVAAGAVMGSAVGPVGTAVGAAIGAVAGGLIGKGVAEGINPTVEDAYWRGTYRSRPYVEADGSYDDYGPAYRYGWESTGRYSGVSFDQAEPELGRDWDDVRGESNLEWEQARSASREAWERVASRRRD